MTRMDRRRDQLQDLTKSSRRRKSKTHALFECERQHRAWRVRVDRRTVGMRQIHAALDPRPARFSEQGSYELNGRPVASFGRRSGRVCESRNRVSSFRVSISLEISRSSRTSNAPHLPRHESERNAGSVRWRRSNGSGWPTGRNTCPASSRADSNSASPWRGPSRASRSSCSRRADRQSRFEERRSRNGSPPRTASNACDNLQVTHESRYARHRRPPHSSLRWPRG